MRIGCRASPLPTVSERFGVGMFDGLSSRRRGCSRRAPSIPGNPATCPRTDDRQDSQHAVVARPRPPLDRSSLHRVDGVESLQ